MLPGEYLGPRGHILRTVGILNPPHSEKLDPKQGSCCDPFKAGAWTAGPFLLSQMGWGLTADLCMALRCGGTLSHCCAAWVSGGPFLPASTQGKNYVLWAGAGAVRGEHRLSSKLLSLGKLHIAQMRILLWVEGLIHLFFQNALC